MNKKALILLLILTIPAYTFLIPTSNPNNSLKTITTTYTKENSRIIVQSIQNNPIKTTDYTAPWELKILWDAKHQGYWTEDMFDYMINDIKNYFGANVTINKKLFNETDLTQYDLIVIPASSGNLTNEEILALRNYLENNGTLLLMGDRSAYYPKYLNATTLPYGIGWYNTTIHDDTDNSYGNPLVHVWGNNTVAKYITGGHNDLVFKTSGCPILVIGDNTTTKIYIVATGDDDTYADWNKPNGTNINYMVAVDLQKGGRIFAVSGPTGFRDKYGDYYYKNDSYIAKRIVSWLLSEGLEIINISAPTSLIVNDESYISYTVKNNLATNATNVKVAIEFNEGLEVLNGTQEVTIGTMTPGEVINVTWHVKAINPAEAKITLKVWGDNAIGFSRALTINIKGLTVSTKTIPRYLMSPSNVTVTVNVTNPQVTGVNTTANVSILVTSEEVSYPWYNQTSVQITLNSSKIFEFNITVENITKAQSFKVLVIVNTTNLGLYKVTYEFYAFVRHVAVFYQKPIQYSTADKFATLLKNVSTYLDVFIMNDTITDELLNITKLVILPKIDYEMSNDEIMLLKNFLDNGGSMILMGTWFGHFKSEYLSYFNELTSEYNITWYHGEIMDDTSNAGKPYYPILNQFADNPYALYVKRGVESVNFYSSTHLNIIGSNVYPILLGNPTSYAVDDSGKPIGINGTQIVAMAVAKTTKGGLIVASGSVDAFKYYRGNNKLISNIVDLILKGDFVYDIEPPSIRLNTQGLKNYSCVPNQFTLSWMATDNVRVETINIYINGELIATLDGTTSSYNFNLVEDGVYTIKVEAVDWLGHTDSFTIVLIVDQTPPVITITSPSDGYITGETSVVITWTVDDPAVPLVGHYEIYLDSTLVNDSVPGTATSYTLTGLTDGTHNITIVAYSCNTHSSVSINITVDLSGPIVHYSPANGSNVPSPFNITFNASDVSGLQRYEILIDGSVVHSGTLSGTSATVTYTVSDLVGTHTITIRVYDTLGHVTELSFVVNVTPTTGGGIGTVTIGIAAVVIIAIIGTLIYFFRKRGA